MIHYSSRGSINLLGGPSRGNESKREKQGQGGGKHFFSFPLSLSLSCLFTRTINLDGASGCATGFDRKGGKEKRKKKKKEEKETIDTAIVRKRKYVSSSEQSCAFLSQLVPVVWTTENVSHARMKLALGAIS